MDLKTRFLASAYYLFTTQGYKQTTVADIITHAGGSIGGFYHHFNSKESALDAVLEQTFDAVIADFDQMLQSGNATAAKLFNSVFVAICATDPADFTAWSKIGRILVLNDHDYFLQRMIADFELVTTKLYSIVINKGVESGVFTVRYTHELANLWTREILHILNVIRRIKQNGNDYNIEAFKNMLEFAEDTFSHALGLKYYKLSIKKIVMDYLQAILADNDVFKPNLT